MLTSSKISRSSAIHLASLCMLQVAQIPESPVSTLDAVGGIEGRSIFFGTLHCFGRYSTTVSAECKAIGTHEGKFTFDFLPPPSSASTPGLRFLLSSITAIPQIVLLQKISTFRTAKPFVALGVVCTCEVKNLGALATLTITGISVQSVSNLLS